MIDFDPIHCRRVISSTRIAICQAFGVTNCSPSVRGGIDFWLANFLVCQLGSGVFQRMPADVGLIAPPGSRPLRNEIEPIPHSLPKTGPYPAKPMTPRSPPNFRSFVGRGDFDFDPLAEFEGRRSSRAILTRRTRVWRDGRDLPAGVAGRRRRRGSPRLCPARPLAGSPRRRP